MYSHLGVQTETDRFAVAIKVLIQLNHDGDAPAVLLHNCLCLLMTICTLAMQVPTVVCRAVVTRVSMQLAAAGGTQGKGYRSLVKKMQ